tara:strand:- start:44 stop:262 length:219 start_codon:yes stop_codon:yes gene_type:complete
MNKFRIGANQVNENYDYCGQTVKVLWSDDKFLMICNILKDGSEGKLCATWSNNGMESWRSNTNTRSGWEKRL